MKNSENKEIKEIGLKNVFNFILNGLFLFFFITSGCIMFKEKKIVASLLYFVLAILAVVPHKLLRVTQALKIVILIILFVILATAAAQGDPIAQQKYEYLDLGETFNLTFGKNTFSMAVQEINQDTKIITSGKEAKTSGYFLVVVANITNLGSEAVDFKLEKAPTLKDAQNRNYSLYGAKIAEGKLQPSVAKEFSYVFEIPKDSSGLKFIIKDKTAVAKSVDLKR